MPLPSPVQSAPAPAAASHAVPLPVLERVRSGELWQFGDHRLLCGDCTDIAVIARLMQSAPEDVGSSLETADMLFLDPPYGVSYGLPAHKAVRKAQPIRGDNLGEYGTYDLLKQALQTAPLKSGGAFYVCSTGGANELLFRLALRDAGLPLKQSLVWVKHHFVLSRQDYHWKHETLLYGWKPGAAHCWNGGRTQTTVWEIPRPQKSALHPTMKPLQLVQKAIQNSSNVGEIVYDGFGGSGTTLLACEQTGRKCRMLEVEPHYCNVILQRWEEASGKTAVRQAEQRGC